MSKTLFIQREDETQQLVLSHLARNKIVSELMASPEVREYLLPRFKLVSFDRNHVTIG
jgi:hypothetical protein